MGVWSRKVGEQFLDWLNPPPNLSWLDVGAGNGAFTALLAERVKPASILGVALPADKAAELPRMPI
jgi:ubiquinone/menaquinone biosynthesis C-methylase UbiE